MTTAAIETRTEHELVITRLIDAPRDRLFRCPTEPALITRWFTPPPRKTVAAEVEPRAGGASLITMEGPDGTPVPNRGVYLEFVPNERIVFTDAYTPAWVPSAKPFFTGILTFEDDGGRTRCTARARHWNARGLRRPREDGLRRRLGPSQRSTGSARSHALTSLGQQRRV